MIALYITLGVLLLLILTYLFLLYPGRARKGIFSSFCEFVNKKQKMSNSYC